MAIIAEPWIATIAGGNSIGANLAAAVVGALMYFTTLTEVPIMDDIREEYPQQVKVIFHDVWTNEGRPYANEYGIRVIPTQVFLDGEGKEFFRHEGFLPKEQLIEVLKQNGVEP